MVDYREENSRIGPVSGILDGNRQELIAPKLVEATVERAPVSLQEITTGEFGWVLGGSREMAALPVDQMDVHVPLKVRQAAGQPVFFAGAYHWAVHFRLY